MGGEGEASVSGEKVRGCGICWDGNWEWVKGEGVWGRGRAGERVFWKLEMDRRRGVHCRSAGKGGGGAGIGFVTELELFIQLLPLISGSP